MDKFWYLMGAIDCKVYGFRHYPQLDTFVIRWRSIMGEMPEYIEPNLALVTGTNQWISYCRGWFYSMLVNEESGKSDIPY